MIIQAQRSFVITTTLFIRPFNSILKSTLVFLWNCFNSRTLLYGTFHHFLTDCVNILLVFKEWCICFVVCCRYSHAYCIYLGYDRLLQILTCLLYLYRVWSSAADTHMLIVSMWCMIVCCRYSLAYCIYIGYDRPLQILTCLLYLCRVWSSAADTHMLIVSI